MHVMVLCIHSSCYAIVTARTGYNFTTMKYQWWSDKFRRILAKLIPGEPEYRQGYQNVMKKLQEKFAVE